MMQKRTIAARGLAAAVTLAGAIAAGCESATDPAEAFPGLITEEFDPPPVYATWWAETKECSGRSRGFGRLRFFAVLAPLDEGGANFPRGVEDARSCSGFWQKPHDIVIAPAFFENERLLKHEMLHDLLGTVRHLPEFRICGVR